MSKKTRELVIHRDLILGILRRFNEDRVYRVEGIPDDAVVCGAEFDVVRGCIVLDVETESGEDGEPLKVLVHDEGSRGT